MVDNDLINIFDKKIFISDSAKTKIITEALAASNKVVFRTVETGVFVKDKRIKYQRVIN